MAHVAVIVGRFQTPYLHEGHLHLFRRAVTESARLIVFLGVAPVPVSKKNPLDFTTRKQMLMEHLIEIAPEATILPLPDVASDVEWVKDLDARIREVEPFAKIKLYGGRNSFLDTYKWHSTVKHARSDVEAWPANLISSSCSATQVRQDTAFAPVASEDFRTGAVYASQRRYSSGIATVDVAVYDRARDKFLLGKKLGRKGFCFVGGFYDPELDLSLACAARREASEETGDLGLGAPQYIGSARINDWRYPEGGDRIITTLFLMPYLHGAATAGDDLNSVQWFSLAEMEHELVPEHKPLRALLLHHFQKGAAA